MLTSYMTQTSRYHRNLVQGVGQPCPLNDYSARRGWTSEDTYDLRNTANLNGELSEWLKEPVLKTGDSERNRGSESRTLCQNDILKGKYYMTKYKGIKINGKKHDYHRWLMEQELGRKLDRNEVVHHINEDARDNDVTNLCVMSLSEHGKLHRLGKRLSSETREKISHALAGRQNIIARKLTDEQVLYIRENYIPMNRKFGTRALSREFGVHHSTIEKIVSGKIYCD